MRKKGFIRKIKIAENIRNLRKAHFYTQEQLAEALGVTVGAVYKWEAGLSMPEIKLIMEIADFFEVSVDMLLGYEQKSGNVEKGIQKIKQCIIEKNFEEGVTESDKLLKKYPNNFEIVYASAMMYMLMFSEDKCVEFMIKSNQLFEKAITLLYQNTNEHIHEATILNHMASNYLASGKTEQALEILKKNNICNINSSLIGYIYASQLEKPGEAKNYLISSMSEIINHIIRTVSGMAFMYAREKDETCLSVTIWLVKFFDSLKADDTTITFLDKFKAIAIALCSVWEASFGYKDEADKHILEAFILAKQFDASPVYTMQGVNLFKGIEKEGVSFDGIGKTAVEAVENFVFSKISDSKAEKQIKEKWEALKIGCTDAG